MKIKVALVVAFLLVCGVAAADLPWTTQGIAGMLGEAGFSFLGLEGDTVWMQAPGPVVAKVKVDGRGKVTVAGVGFYGRNMDAVYMAMAAFYVFMQADMGKSVGEGRADVDRMVVKMRRLEDTIAHNLKLNPATRFTYDDFDVAAWKGDGGYIVIEFRPEWR